ncbi:MAG: DUF551 domain-containing protein [Bacteroidales bacterium]|nr:DUF551 domain-containing protein [Bacteroidales bacterium]
MSRKENKLCSSCGHFKTMGENENRHHYCIKNGKAKIIDHFFISNNGLCDEFEPRNNNTSHNTEDFTPVFGQWYDAEKYTPTKTYYLDKDGSIVYIPFLVTYLSFYDKVTPCSDTLAIYRDGEWFWAEGDESVAVKITHWMPLPEPAKREVTK